MTGGDLFLYNSSPLNPLLKILIFALFLIVIYIYYDIRGRFGGQIRSFTTLLLLFCIFMALGSFFRIFGHGIDFGLTSDYSLKWLQSLAYLSGSICICAAAFKLLILFGRDHDHNRR